MMDIKGVLLRWFINFLIKNFCCPRKKFAVGAVKTENMSNQELAEKLHNISY